MTSRLPPRIAMFVAKHDPASGLLVLSGPKRENTTGGKVLAAVGAGISFLGLTAPGLFKLIPLAVGGGLAATGLHSVLFESTTTIKRGDGVRFHWRVKGFLEERLFVPQQAIAKIEIIKRHLVEEPDEDRVRFAFGNKELSFFKRASGRSHVDETYYDLTLVTHAGESHPLDILGTETTAELRKRTVEDALFGAVRSQVEPPQGTPQHRSRVGTDKARRPRSRRRDANR